MTSVDLRTRYLGLELRSPVIAAASPLCRELDSLRRLERSGAAAVVLPSLFEEQIVHDQAETARLYELGSHSQPEAHDYFPVPAQYNGGPDAYLRLVEQASQALSIPVIGSLNGISPGGWLRYARSIEQAGADALELNVYVVPTDPEMSGAEVEQRYLDLVASVRDVLSIPLAVKVGPYFSAMAHMALRLEAAGADGLVLFNRFLHPELDLETLKVRPRLELSTSAELRLPLRWIALLYGRVAVSLAATGGVAGAEGVLQALLTGADVVAVASTLLRQGPESLEGILSEVRDWMAERGYVGVEQLKGSASQLHGIDPEAFERANYMEALTSFTPSR